MVRVIIAGKFDPILAGHLDHYFKARKLGSYIIVITHPDHIVAKTSKKGFCALPIGGRYWLLQRMVGQDGEVILAHDRAGKVVETLKYLRKKYPDDRLIFAKGGDRTPSNMPEAEIATCREWDIELVYGVGDLLSSSSDTMMRIKESE